MDSVWAQTHWTFFNPVVESHFLKSFGVHQILPWRCILNRGSATFHESTIHLWDFTHCGQLATFRKSWWRHQRETFSALLALCAGNSPGPVNSPHKGQWRGALMFSLTCVWINGWVNNREAGDLRRHRGHYDVNVMIPLHDSLRVSRSIYFSCNWKTKRYRLSFYKLLNDPILHFLKSTQVKRGYHQYTHKQRVLMHRHEGWNVRHGLCHIYMRYLYIYELFIAFVCFVVCSLL